MKALKHDVTFTVSNPAIHKTRFFSSIESSTVIISREGESVEYRAKSSNWVITVKNIVCTCT